MKGQSRYKSLVSNVAAEVQGRRVALGKSINQLAQEAGISWSMAKAVEAGVHRPSIETLARIADALDTTGSTILASAESKL